ncbi:MAG: translation elongation factor [Conexivisphaera sp.]
MLSGGVISVLSPDRSAAEELAGRLGKRKEEGKYYRKSGDKILTILVPGGSILEAAEALTASDWFYLVAPELTRDAAELALLAEASGKQGRIISGDPERFSAALGGLGVAGMVGNFEPREPSAPDLGFALVDSAFVVRGVGPVALGITFMGLAVHDEVELLPSGKRASIRSIQVLDEDQDAVGPGVRYGASLRGVEERDLKECYGIARPGSPTTRTIRVSVRFPLAPDARSLHAVLRGVGLFGSLTLEELALERPAPAVAERAVLVNVNAPRGKLRVYGAGMPVTA